MPLNTWFSESERTQDPTVKRWRGSECSRKDRVLSNLLCKVRRGQGTAGLGKEIEVDQIHPLVLGKGSTAIPTNLSLLALNTHAAIRDGWETEG
jgi:hypothetical protein